MNDESDEARLLRLAREGDRSAFERLYRDNVRRVYGLCRRLTGNSSEAEDLTQETFLRAWVKLGSFAGRSRFSSWLHRLAINLALNRRRAGARVPQGRDENTPDPHEAVAQTSTADERRDLERAIAGLPDAARFVLVLHDVYGYAHEEIADAAGIAIGTSKSQLHRARKLLREALS